MSAFWLGFYVLLWPAISAAVLAMIWIAMVRETRAARETGEEMV